MKNDIFWSEIGARFGEPDGTPSPRIPRNTPPPGLFSQHDLGLQTLEVYESFYLYYIFLTARAYQLQHATRKFIKTRKA